MPGARRTRGTWEELQWGSRENGSGWTSSDRGVRAAGGSGPPSSELSLGGRRAAIRYVGAIRLSSNRWGPAEGLIRGSLPTQLLLQAPPHPARPCTPEPQARRSPRAAKGSAEPGRPVGGPIRWGLSGNRWRPAEGSIRSLPPRPAPASSPTPRPSPCTPSLSHERAPGQSGGLAQEMRSRLAPADIPGGRGARKSLRNWGSWCPGPGPSSDDSRLRVCGSQPREPQGDPNHSLV